MEADPQRRTGRLRLVFFVAMIAAALTVAALLLFRAGRDALDSGLLADLVSDAVAEATDGRYVLGLDSLRVDLDEPGVTLFGGALRSSDSTSGPTRTQFEGGFIRAHLGAVDLWDLARGRLPKHGYVQIDKPAIHIRVGTADSVEVGPESTDVLADIGRRLHDLGLDSLSLRDVTVSLTLEAGAWTDTLHRLDLRLTDILVDSSQSAFDRGFMFGRELSVFVAPHSRLSADGLYTLSLGGIRGSSTEKTLRLDSLGYRPNYSNTELIRRRGHRAGRYDITTGAIVASGLDLPAFIERRRFIANLVTIDRPRLDYFNDLRWPPGPARRKTLPHEKLQSLGSVFRIDTLRVDEGNVVYRRFAGDGARRGSLPFSGFAVSAQNLTNDPERMGPATPAIVQANARLAGAARLSATIRMNLLDDRFNMDCQGSLGAMQLQPLNDLLVSSEGLRIRGGSVERVRFEFGVSRGLARGTLDARYRDLNISEVDKRTGDTDLRDRIRAFLVNRVILRSDNPPQDGKQPHRGVIEHRYASDQTILRFLWLSVRSGIFSVTGMYRIEQFPVPGR